MSYRWFVHEVARRAHHDNIDAVEVAVTDVLVALGKRLCDLDARAVAAQLPPSLADPFLSAVLGQDRSEEVAALPSHIDPRIVRAVCRLLAEQLDEQARTHLRMQPLQALFIE